MDTIKIPPFSDAHMHFVINSRPATAAELLYIKNKLIGHGVFAVNDMGHKSGIGLEAKHVLNRDLKVLSAGYAIYKKGTYGAFLGKGVSGRGEIKVAATLFLR